MNKVQHPLDPFPDLTQEETRLLCFISYYGDDSGVGAYRRHYGIDKETCDNQAYRLQQLGYLERHDHASARHHLDVLDHLACFRHEWLEAFKGLKSGSPSQSAGYLWKIADLLRRDDFEGAGRLYPPYEGLSHRHFNILPYIRERAAGDPRYLTLMEGEQRREMISEYLEGMMAECNLDSGGLDVLRKMAGSGKVKDQALQDRLRLYEWLATGRYDIPEGNTSWALAMAAVRAQYEGHMEDALSLFQEAVAKQLPSGAFPSPVLNFLYAICLLRYRRKYGQMSAVAPMNALRTSSAVRLDKAHQATRLLLEYGELSTEDIGERIGTRIQTFENNSQGRGFARLLSYYFGTAQKEEAQIPTLAILQHELAPYEEGLSENARLQLESSFGGSPLLSGLHRKASWEILLGEIDSAISQSVDSSARRIIYFLSGGRLSCMMEQKRHEDGSWRDERVLSIRQFCTDGYDSMDMSDTQAALQLNRKDESQSDAEVIVPLLKDSGRLFAGAEYASPREHAEVITEPPYLKFSNEQGMIAITSNVRMNEDGLPRKHTVTLTGGRYRLTSINPLQADVLGKILHRRSLPASAAPALRHTIQSLKGILEVKEDILSGLEECAVRSEGCLAVRIEPVDNGKEYQVTFLAAPLRDGITRIKPGEGELFVFDEDENRHTHCVQRNMELECENLHMLTDFARQFEAEMTEPNVCRFSSERTLLNLLCFCYRCQDRFIPEWPQGKALKFKGVLSHSDINIEVKSDVDWFSVEGEVMLRDSPLSLEELVAACSRSGDSEFIQIGDNEYIRMTDTLRKHIAELDSVLRMSDTPKKKHVPKYLAGALARTLEGISHSTDNGYRDFMQKMKEAYGREYEIPKGLNAVLRPYQREGYMWMRRMDAWGAGVCLADDMGLGKTLQALAFLLSKADEGPSLVVAPKSVLPNWASEAFRFTPGLKVTILNDEDDRTKAVSEAAAGDLILCTYGVLTSEAELLQSRVWNTVCLDEAHQIKNHNTQVSQSAMDLRSGSRIILTGTPLQNHAGELWNLMQFINPGLLGRWNVFRDTYVNADTDEDHRDMLREMTQPFILRRTKQEVLTDLPEKTEGIFYVTMTEDEMQVYEKMRARLELKFKKDKTRAERHEAAAIDVSYLAELMKLREVCCDMKMVHEQWLKPGSKLNALMDILESLMEVPDNGILVFSQFTSFLDIVRKELEKRGWEHLYLDGQTPMKERRKCVEQFQTRMKKLFVSSLKAGGLGLNLTAANYVILLDPWWNPAIEHQATDRAHRIGQQRSVSVIRLICEHTIEEKILHLHEKKQSLSDDLLDGTSQSSSLTYEDVLDMVTPF